jgi:microcompartment protein CcmL/EutN
MTDAHRLMADSPFAIEPALGLLELSSIAAGIAAGDAMAKRAPVDVLRAGTVHPGKYLVLVGGSVADVEEALESGREAGTPCVVDEVFLPNVHPELVDAIGGACREAAGEALGVIETSTVAAIIEAADAGLKGARVRLVELRLADDLGGKGYLLFDGPVGEVEAAVEIGIGRILGAAGLAWRVIAQLHAEMASNLAADARFRERSLGAASKRASGAASKRASGAAPTPAASAAAPAGGAASAATPATAGRTTTSRRKAR